MSGKPAASHKGDEVITDERGMCLLNEVNGTVRAEPERLRRALANLLVNAMRYGRRVQP